MKERHGLGSVEPLHAGLFTVVQRFRADLGLYVHLHCLVTDGAFEEAGAGVRFLPAATPTPERMTAVLAQVHKAVAAVAEDDDLDMDPALAACVQLGLAGPHAVQPEPATRPPLTVSAFELQLDLDLPGAANDNAGEAADTSPRPRRLGWANLLARVFAIDVTVCRKCGGRMRVLEVVSDPDDIARVLHGARAPPRPPRPHPPGQILLFAS